MRVSVPLVEEADVVEVRIPEADGRWAEDTDIESCFRPATGGGPLPKAAVVGVLARAYGPEALALAFGLETEAESEWRVFRPGDRAPKRVVVLVGDRIPAVVA